MATQENGISKQKERKYRKELHQRLSDIYAGACGEIPNDEDGWLNINDLPDVIYGINAAFPELKESAYSYTIKIYNAGRFETVDEAVDHLLSFYIALKEGLL